MKRHEFLQMMEELLAIEPGTLSDTQRLRELEGWGSLAVMECMAQVEEKTGILLQPKKIALCETVSDLYQLLEESNQAAV